MLKTFLLLVLIFNAHTSGAVDYAVQYDESAVVSLNDNPFASICNFDNDDTELDVLANVKQIVNNKFAHEIVISNIYSADPQSTALFAIRAPPHSY